VLTTEQFDRTRVLALRLAGIELQERHHQLLCQRYQRIETSAPTSFDALLCAAEEGDPQARRQLVALITTNFTSFFRHPHHFERAVEHALAAIRRCGRARLWSAAAATGEEPYSLAMALIETSERDDPPATILATDIDDDALALAHRAEYSKVALGSLSPERCARFLTPLLDGKFWKMAPAVCRMVEFRVVNLAGSAWKVTGPFDVIFCRNVLMYLETSRRHATLERMASLLTPDGVLILDPTEHLGKAGHLFAQRADGVCLRRPEQNFNRS
jgi:chemotaxis protein methyltransferase CheR